MTLRTTEITHCPSNMTIRDIIALPFSILAAITTLIALAIGGERTKNSFEKVVTGLARKWKNDE